MVKTKTYGGILWPRGGRGGASSSLAHVVSGYDLALGSNILGVLYLTGVNETKEIGRKCLRERHFKMFKDDITLSCTKIGEFLLFSV